MMRSLSAGAALLALATLLPAADDYRPGPNRADEPAAKAFSLEQAGRFLDHVGTKWTAERKCVTCHTNVAALWAKPEGDAAATVRAFFEKRALNWGSGSKGDRPKNGSDVVATAVTLAVHDAKTTGKLHPATKAALEKMWAVQQPSGAWDWEKCGWPPQEHDDEFGAVFAAVGVGMAPEGYAKSPAAKAGLAKLRAYLAKTPPPSLHHRAWLLWASARLDGLMTAEERKKTVQALRDAQKPDGGWSLPSLGDWKGYDERPNDTKAASDGYGTGLAVLVLREAGVAKDDAAVASGVKWLKANQRESGRWWTRSLNTERAHYISHVGTAYAVMALEACK